jgi:hypothetical protein
MCLPWGLQKKGQAAFSVASNFSFGGVCLESITSQIQLLFLLLGFLGSCNLAHLLSYLPGKFRIFEMDAFYSSRRHDGPLDQESPHFRIFGF